MALATPSHPCHPIRHLRQVHLFGLKQLDAGLQQRFGADGPASLDYISNSSEWCIADARCGSDSSQEEWAGGVGSGEIQEALTGDQ